MSGTTVPQPESRPRTTHDEIYKTPVDRARIQAKMLRTIQQMKDEDAIKNDMAAFFGERSDDSNFGREQNGGLNNLQIASNRLSLARLYMLKQGVPLETILSQDPTAIAEKKKWGEQFCEIIFSNDRRLIARECNSLTQFANKTVFDPLVLLDDETLTDNFAKLEIIREGVSALHTSMRNSTAGNATNDKDFDTLIQTDRGANAIGIVLHTASLKITDESYSKENSGLRQELGKNLPEHGLTPAVKEQGVKVGYELSTSLEYLHAIASKKEDGVPISFMAGLERMIQDASNMNSKKKKDGEVPKNYADIYADLMDFEELAVDNDKKLIAVPRDLQAERDRVQTTLIKNIRDAYSTEASNNDITAFFGQRTDNDFRTNAAGGANLPDTLFRIGSRLSLARLYMVAVGEFTVDQVLSRDQDMMLKKQEWGEKFCNVMLSGDAALIGEATAKMGKFLLNSKIPDIDLNDDFSIASNYTEVKFLISSEVDFKQFMHYPIDHKTAPKGATAGIVNDFRSRMTKDELKQYDKLHYGINDVFKAVINPKIVEIVSDQYSAANTGQKSGIKYGITSIHDGQVNEVDFIRAAHTNAVHKEACNKWLKAAVGKGFDAISGISVNTVQEVVPTPEEAKAVKRNFRTVGGPATGREAMSLEDFQDEVNIVKQTHKQAQARDVFKSGAPKKVTRK